MQVLLTSGIVCRRTTATLRFGLLALFLPLSQSFRLKPMAVHNNVPHGRLYMRVWILCTICTCVVRLHTFAHSLCTVGNACAAVQCFCKRTKRKRITEWEKRVGAPSQTTKTQTVSWKATVRGRTKLCGSVAGSHVTAFLATTAPWEPYFTDNPRKSALFLNYF